MSVELQSALFILRGHGEARDAVLSPGEAEAILDELRRLNAENSRLGRLVSDERFSSPCIGPAKCRECRRLRGDAQTLAGALAIIAERGRREELQASEAEGQDDAGARSNALPLDVPIRECGLTFSELVSQIIRIANAADASPPSPQTLREIGTALHEAFMLFRREEARQ